MLSIVLSPLAWIGRQGARAIAVLVLFGLALPPVGALLRPYVQEAVFVMLTLAFLRVDAEALRHHLRNPALIAAAAAWTALGVPLLFYGVAWLAGMADRAPDLYLAFMLQAATSPITATPAFAMLIGLDATLALITLVCGTLLVPLVAPLVARFALGGSLTLSPMDLGLKLALLLGGALLLAMVLRRLIGDARIARNADAANGLNVLVMMVFVMAVMSDVAARAWADPLLFLGLTAMAFAVFYAVLFISAALFWRTGWKSALTLGASVSQRNLGLMLAATEGLPGLVWIYVALAQFPIYLSPLLVRPMVAVMERRDVTRRPAP